MLATAMLGATVPAAAGPFADDMGRCLVTSTTAAEKSALVKWIFAIIALHPEVADLAAVGAAERAKLNQRLGDLVVDLLTKRCAAQSRLALKNEGMGVIETSFSVLGQSAAQELFTHPAVGAGLADFGKSLDAAKLEPLIKGE
jgi:NADPH:quinone reductase-like Zn-dependent oxidoreductase